MSEERRYVVRSCCVKDVLHIVERVTMAGIVGEHSQRLYGVAANCLEAKMKSAASDLQNEADDSDEKEESGGIDYETIIRSLRDASFGLHSERSLLGLWRFSTRQRKQRVFSGMLLGILMANLERVIQPLLQIML